MIRSHNDVDILDFSAMDEFFFLSRITRLNCGAEVLSKFRMLVFIARGVCSARLREGVK